MVDTVAVIGATGNVGSRLVQKLAAQKIPVRAISRDPDPASLPPGVRPIAADVTDINECRRALDGAEIVYFTPPLGGDTPEETELKAAQNVAQVCSEYGCTHLVAHTALQADVDSPSAILRNKAAVEAEIINSGVPWSIIRPAYFLENFFGAKDYIQQGILSMPIGETRRLGVVSVDDIAEAAIGLIDAGPQGRTFDLHVPGGVSMEEFAECCSQAAGTGVAYQQFTDDVREFVEPFPITAPHKDMYAGLMEYFQDTDYIGDSGDIQEVIKGFAYTSPQDFASHALFAEIDAAR